MPVTVKLAILAPSLILYVTVSLATVAVNCPAAPANVNVSASRSTLVLPVVPTMFNVVAIFAVPAAVKRPFESTVKVGIAVALPYDPAVTAVLANVNAMLAWSPAFLNVAVPVASLLMLIVTLLLNAFAVAAPPAILPTNQADVVILPEALTVVKLAAAAAVLPITVPSIAPPVIATLLLA